MADLGRTLAVGAKVKKQLIEQRVLNLAMDSPFFGDTLRGDEETFDIGTNMFQLRSFTIIPTALQSESLRLKMACFRSGDGGNLLFEIAGFPDK